MAVGRSADPDPIHAGRQAAHEALRGGVSAPPDPRLLIVFSSAEHDPVAVVAGIAQEAPGVPLVGCSSASAITPDGPVDSGVVVMAVGGPGFSVATAVAHASSGRQREAGAEVATACLSRAADLPYRMLLLMTDGFTADQEVILAGVYSVVGASVPLIGGSASPVVGKDRTFQMHGTDVFTDSVVGVMLASEGPFGVGLRHGWRRVGEPLIVTQSLKGLVKTLNDRPALPAYLQTLDAPALTHRDPAAFHAYAKTRPIGVSRRHGDEVRDVCSADYFEEGWLRSSGEIPEGGLIWLMEGDTGSVLDAAGGAARDAVAALGGHPPIGLLAFDCVSRQGVLGDEGTRREVERMAALGLPLAGMYTWGEIARTRGINGYHNLTLAVLALS
jgi:hypothetical protein